MTKKRDPSLERPDPPLAAYTIDQFCRSHGISPAFYFQLQKSGRGPRVMRIGKRVLISAEAASEWREARTAAA